MNILITGATGNIGREVIRHFDYTSADTIFAGVRTPQAARFPAPVKVRAFNFDDLEGAHVALDGIDVVFLLRPPQIADMEKVFHPIVDLFVRRGIKHIVCLSVQGAETQPLIPHFKLERLVRKSGIPYTLVRPSYFMQNLTTTLRKDVQRGEIYLPAGKARFNWVDAADVGRAIATVLKAPERHRGRAYVITGREQLSFNEVAAMISRVTGRSVRFRSPSLPSFFLRKKREGENTSMIFVLVMLHVWPRFSRLPPLSDDFMLLTGREPGTLEEFLEREMMG